jgi:hypothetical protein
MKIDGKKLEGINTVRVILPRQDGDIILIARGVPSYKGFEEVCPRPVPQMKTFPDGHKEAMIKDPSYEAAISTWAERKSTWLVLESLSATPGLEWETVDRNDPETWGNFNQELIDSGFSEFEVVRIIDGVMTANGLNQTVLDQAEKRFLAGQVAAQ